MSETKIEMVTISPKYPYRHPDCIVLRRLEGAVEIAFPFHEDTPNFILGIGEALDLQHVLQDLINVKLIMTKGGIVE